MKRKIALIVVLILVVGSIWYLESIKPETADVEADIEVVSETEKAEMYEVAKEISTPDGFINVDDINITDLIGEQVILVDFWTYSCINCQRTFPYLNAWQERYADKGLTMIGIHTPEFEFEKKFENVAEAVERYGIKFPVVLDNDYSTWRSYKNRFWPRKYIIDIDGYIVYDHIGEGAYQETEDVIKDLLKERADKLGIEVDLPAGYASVDASEKVASDLKKTPEIYFGANRNEYFTNGKQGKLGMQKLEFKGQAELNELNLSGEWDILEEYAKALSAGSRVILNYNAEELFMVASSENTVKVKVTLDGQTLPEEMAGADVVYEDNEAFLYIQEDRLYKVVEGKKGIQNHTITLESVDAGLKAFTFTFG